MACYSNQMEYFSHTMITTLGEFIFTLKDVHVLLELSYLGQHDICSFKLFEEEEQVHSFFCDLLKSEHEKSKAARKHY